MLLVHFGVLGMMPMYITKLCNFDTICSLFGQFVAKKLWRHNVALGSAPNSVTEK
jgi:hypothetical protein